MDYDKNETLVDEICAQLPNRDFQEDDPNPLHQVFRSKGFKEYYLQKVHMAQFAKANQYSQGLSSQVNKNDKKKNAVEIIMQSDGAGPKAPSADDLIKEKLTIITSALPKLDKLLKDFKKTKASIMTSKSPAGKMFSIGIQMTFNWISSELQFELQLNFNWNSTVVKLSLVKVHWYAIHAYLLTLFAVRLFFF